MSAETIKRRVARVEFDESKGTKVFLDDGSELEQLTRVSASSGRFRVQEFSIEGIVYLALPMRRL